MRYIHFLRIILTSFLLLLLELAFMLGLLFAPEILESFFGVVFFAYYPEPA